MFFCFSSRRRHTRWPRDWSSDVCSSDLTAAADGTLGALLVGGIDLEDLPDPALAERALAGVGSVVQLEVRRSAVTEHADVVLPVAPPTGKSGTFLNWESRPRPRSEEHTSELQSR